MPASPRRLPLAFAVALLALAPASSEASELQVKIDSLAKRVASLLKDESQTEVALGPFTGPPAPATSSGPGLRQLLAEALAKHQVKFASQAWMTLRGEYEVREEEDRKEELIVGLRLALRNKRGKHIAEFKEPLTFKNDGNDDMVRLLGLQVDLSKRAKATSEDRNHEIKKQMAEPPLKVNGHKVKTTDVSPYAVEVLVKAKGEKEYKPATPREKNGWAFVEVKKGDEYALRLHNGSKHEAAAQVFVDGIDAFAFFEPAKDRPSAFLVAPLKEREIHGWPRSSAVSNTFQLHEYSSSAAAKVIKGGEKVQTITVLFRASWTGNKPPPEHEGFYRVPYTGVGFNPARKLVRRHGSYLLAAVTIRIER